MLLPAEVVKICILDIKSLATQIQDKANSDDPFTSADFSLEMVEGSERVRFKVNEGGAL